MNEKTKIICTLGTTTDDDAVLERMVNAGMTGIRLNTAYATIEDYSRRVVMAKKANKDLSVMLDIKGPQVRLGNFDAFTISKGREFLIGFPDANNNSNNTIYFSKDFHKDLKKGDYVLIENGTIVTEVIEKYPSDVRLRIIEPGEGIIHKHMGVNVPGVYLHVPGLSEKDKEVISWGLEQKVEQIALSFVRDAEDLKNCYEYMKQADPKRAEKTEIVLKIEDRFGVENLDSILKYSKKNEIKTSVMVARGDLYVELGAEELPYAQEYIIKTSQKNKVPVMVGTGVLESMQHGKKPTRAEICDIYNILRSGVNYFMLSGETSFGDNPPLVVETLTRTAKRYYENKTDISL